MIAQSHVANVNTKASALFSLGAAKISDFSVVLHCEGERHNSRGSGSLPYRVVALPISRAGPPTLTRAVTKIFRPNYPCGNVIASVEMGYPTAHFSGVEKAAARVRTRLVGSSEVRLGSTMP